LTASELLSTIEPTPASQAQAARRIGSGEVEGLSPLKVAVLSTYSAQLLQPYFIVAGAARGFELKMWFGAFGELESAVLDVDSQLYMQQPDVILVLARIEELAPALIERSLSFSEDELQRQFGEFEARIGALIAGLRQRTDKPVLVANFAPPARLAASLAEPLLAGAPTAVTHHANEAVASFCRVHPGVFVFDYARLVTERGLDAWYDERLFHLARMPFGVCAQIALAGALVRHVRAALIPPAKVLALDLDQTLWGGVLGEEGIGGLALGDEYPGNAFKTFQKYLLTLKDRGVLLAIASKNNEADALEVLARHPDGVLRRGDFTAVRINWQEKSANLRELAAELNVGLESVVFFDDSAFEREEVRRHLPMVTVIDVPESPLEYIDAVEDSGFFDQIVLSAEDRARTELYRQQAARSEARPTSSPEEFLASLEMVATIGTVDAATLPRVAQLLAKTNQFNLTTRRHGAGELGAMIEAGAIALWLRLVDRFGDNGLVGVAIACRIGESWTIDTFLLSCRVIGRGVESALLAQLAACIVKRGGVCLTGEYRPTAKNQLVADFYPRHGFQPDGNANLWRKDLRSTPMVFPPHFRIDFCES
jgi:FkbH-like protein